MQQIRRGQPPASWSWMFRVSEFTTSPMRTIAVEGNVLSFTAPRIAGVAVGINQAGVM